MPVLKGKEDPGHIRFFILNPWVDEHILEVTDKVGGKVSDTSQIRISANGKALTMTYRRWVEAKRTSWCPAGSRQLVRV